MVAVRKSAIGSAERGNGSAFSSSGDRPICRTVWLDGLTLGILLIFTLLGAWRGAFESAVRLLALVLSYAAAILGARVAGPELHTRPVL